MLNVEACGGTLWFDIPFLWFYGEYKSPFVDVCNTLGGPKGLICGLMSDGFALNYLYLVALFPGFTCVTFDTFVALKTLHTTMELIQISMILALSMTT